MRLRIYLCDKHFEHLYAAVPANLLDKPEVAWSEEFLCYEEDCTDEVTSCTQLRIPDA